MPCNTWRIDRRPTVPAIETFSMSTYVAVAVVVVAFVGIAGEE